MVDEGLRPMGHNTIQEAVTNNIRKAISEGQFVPGEKLNYSELARIMEVSITPIREAMRVLAAQGLVTIRTYKSASVASLTIEEIQQIYEIRKTLEGGAMAEAVNNISPEIRSRLKQLVADLEEAAATLSKDTDSEAVKTNVLNIQALHRQFHEMILLAAGNNFLIRIVDFLRGHLGPYFSFNARVIEESRQFRLVEHHGIMKAFAEKDTERAAELMRKHLDITCETLVEYIRSQTAQQAVPIRKIGKINVN
jgi:DNA-binding GntR family transcriptional regulator